MPALCIEPMGASSSPAMPFVIAPLAKTFTQASAFAFSKIHVTTLGLIDRRRSVRHADDARESARRGRARTAGDGFLRRLPGLAEVNVQVDQSGRDDQTGAVDFFNFTLPLSAFRFRRDAAVHDEQFGRLHRGDSPGQ